MNSNFLWVLIATCCYFPLGNSTTRIGNYHPYLSISIHYPNQISCHAVCHQSQNCEPKMKVLAQTSRNMTEESSNKVKILGEGKFFALCFLKLVGESSPFWIKESFLSRHVKNGKIASKFEIFEIGNRRMISEDSLNPRIEIESFGLKNETFSVNCSISLPTRENQNMKLLRVSPAGIHTKLPLNALRLSAAYSGDASSLTIKYKHQFLFTEQYVNDTFKCVAMDVATGKFRTAVSQKIRAGVKCSGQLKIRETSSFYVEGKSRLKRNFSLQLKCSCPGSQPEPDIFWKTPSGELISGPSFIENETLSTGNYCCVAVQNYPNAVVKREGCFSQEHINPSNSASSCKLIKKQMKNAKSQVYNLNIKRNIMKVFCDMESNYQQWIVIQRRLDGTQPFDKSWIEYKNGFGDLNREFWLGNEKLHQLTNAGSMKIRFDVWNKDDKHRYAEYSEFSVSGENDNYRWTISGYSGNAGDISWQNNMQFSTKDRDNDKDPIRSCSITRGNAGWWFNACGANLNGRYHKPGTISAQSQFGFTYKKAYEALKKIIIKITYK